MDTLDTAVLAGELLDTIREKVGELSDTAKTVMMGLAVLAVVAIWVKTKSWIRGVTAALGAAALLAVTGGLPWLSDLFSSEFSAPPPVIQPLHPDPGTPAPVELGGPSGTAGEW